MSLGPVMLDIAGMTLTSEDRELLMHPAVGGLILYSHNYGSRSQLKQLIGDIRQLREELLIAVDQEGGKVQRFVSEFTQLPSLSYFGRRYDEDFVAAKKEAEQSGFTMASELLTLGIDFSFAPVLDLRRDGMSEVIGDRSFHRDPAVVSALGVAYMQGMRRTGMPAVGKHFPGHGATEADSHKAVPLDTREFSVIEETELRPFRDLIAHGLPGIMSSHVVYSKVDDKPATYSRVWLQDILRDKLGFQGVIFSDALDMVGASAVGGFQIRTIKALEAGCDMVLICNDRQGALEAVAGLQNTRDNSQSQQRLLKMGASR